MDEVVDEVVDEAAEEIKSEAATEEAAVAKDAVAAVAEWWWPVAEWWWLVAEQHLVLILLVVLEHRQDAVEQLHLARRHQQHVVPQGDLAALYDVFECRHSQRRRSRPPGNGCHR